LLDTTVAVKLAEPLTAFSSINNYQDTSALYLLDTGIYKMDVYRYSSWIHTTVLPGDTLINVWPVHSSSALYYNYDEDTATGQYFLKPYEQIYIDSIKPDSILVSGYFYKVREFNSGNLIGWLPDNYSVSGNIPRMQVSTLFEHPQINHVHLIREQRVSIYPVPSSAFCIIEILDSQDGDEIDFSVFDLLGNIIYTNSATSSGGAQRFHLPTANYTTGLYMISVSVNGDFETFKLIKQQ